MSYQITKPSVSTRNLQNLEIPYFATLVPAGFPSPAEDYEDVSLDLNSYLVRHPAATFFVRAQGDSMIGVGIYDGDMMIVDRAVTPCSGTVVIAVIYGEFTVKRLIKKQPGRVVLRPANDNYTDIVVSESSNFEIWGVVIHTIHNPNQ